MPSKGLTSDTHNVEGSLEPQTARLHVLPTPTPTIPTPPPLGSVAIHPPLTSAQASEQIQRVPTTRSTDRGSLERQPTINTPPVHTRSLRPQPKNSATTIDQATKFWEAYNKAGDIEDKEFVRSSGGDLDVLLIFAGLFSAIDTAFIIESYKSLKADSADESTKLLRSIILILHNSTYNDSTINPPPFIATSRDVRTNALFFASLCCSLSAAFGAVMAKQWLTQYDQEGGSSLKTPAARGRERQRKFEARSQWRLEDVITTLPTLLQFSLFFFLGGLVDFIWPLNTAVASIIIAFTAATFLFYAITISISIIDRSSPFQTRVSTLLLRTPINLPVSVWLMTAAFYKRLFQRVHQDSASLELWKLSIVVPLVVIKHAGHSLAKGTFNLYKSAKTLFIRAFRSASSLLAQDETAIVGSESLESRCVVYLLERMTVPKDLDMLAEAIRFLPENDSGARAIAKTLTAFHLKPISLDSHGTQWAFPGLRGSSGKGVTKMVRIMVGKWMWTCFRLNRPGPENASTRSLSDYYFRRSLVSALWNAFLANAEDPEAYELTRQAFFAFASSEKDTIMNPAFPFPTNFLAWEAVWRNIGDNADGVVREHTLRLLCLLPTIGHEVAGIRRVLHKAMARYGHLVDILHSTMWTVSGQQADLEDFWMATFRVDNLPIYRMDSLANSRFAEYLATWLTGSVDLNWRARCPSPESFQYLQSSRRQFYLYWVYLLCTCQLVKVNQAWCHELIDHGHISCLSIILKDFPPEDSLLGAPLALYSLLSIWKREGSRDSTNQPRSLLLTSDLVRMVVNSLAPHNLNIGATVFSINQFARWNTSSVGIFGGGDLNPESGPEIGWKTLRSRLVQDIGQMLEWLFAYLEAAGQSGFLPQGLIELTIRNYTYWCEAVDQELELNQYVELSRRLRLVLLRHVQ